jgi:predicted DNA binding protein
VAPETRSRVVTRWSFFAANASACGAPPENPTPPVTFFSAGTVRFEAVGESRFLSEFYTELNDLLDVSIERVRGFRRWSSPTDVTERQRAALEAAVAVGYYAVPRSGTVDDFADRLDCAHSTAGELLRKAKSAVVTAFTRP